MPSPCLNCGEIGPLRSLFHLSSLFSNTFFRSQTVDSCGIGTRIVRVEGEHVNHLTTNRATKRHSSNTRLMCDVSMIFYL